MRRSVLAALFVSACTADPGMLPAERLGPPIDLTVDDLVIGESVTFAVTGATPGDAVTVGFGSGLGFTVCPPAFLGACVLITDPAPLFTGTADANGEWSATVTVPGFLDPGRVLSFQAFAVGATGSASAPFARIVQGSSETDCADARDDDFDGLADCADDDCVASLACTVTCDLGSCCFADDDARTLPERVASALTDADANGGPGNGPYEDHEFVLLDGETLEVDLLADFDGTLHLSDDSCTPIVSAPIAGGTGNLQFTAPADSVYTLTVTSDGDFGDYILGMATEPLPLACTEDPLEPNDNAFTATTLVDGDEIDVVGCLGNTDVFAIDAVAGQVANLRIDWEERSNTQVLDITLTDPAGQPLYQDTDPTGFARILTALPLTGRYLLEIEATGDDPLGLGVGYDIDAEIRTLQPCIDDAFESNDILADATPISLPTDVSAVSCGSDTDLWQLDVQAGQLLQFNLEASLADGLLDVTLLDAVGSPLATAPDAPHRLTWPVAADGLLYLAVEFERDDFQVGAGVPYALAIAQTLPCPEDAFEPNDTQATAPTVPPGTYPGLGACNDDWVQVDLLAGQTLQAALTFADDEGNLDLFLVDAAGNSLNASTTNTDDEQLVYVSPIDQTVALRVALTTEDGLGIVGNTYDLSLTVQ